VRVVRNDEAMRKVKPRDTYLFRYIRIGNEEEREEEEEEQEGKLEGEQD